MKKLILSITLLFFLIPIGFAYEPLFFSVNWEGSYSIIDPMKGEVYNADIPKEFNSLAASPTGKIFAYTYFSAPNAPKGIYEIDPATGNAQFMFRPTNIPFPVIAMAFSPTEKLYVIERDGREFLGVINMNTKEYLRGPRLKPYEFTTHALDYSPSGILYGAGIDSTTDDLNKGYFLTIINEEGEISKVSESPIENHASHSIVFSEDGRLFSVGLDTKNDNYNFVEVDPVTGQMIGKPLLIGRDMRGLEILPPEVDVDKDGIPYAKDECWYTELPEKIERLRPGHFADIDGDKIFETIIRGKIVDSKFTLNDTEGCSCTQILEKNTRIYDERQKKYGCFERTIAKSITQ